MVLGLRIMFIAIIAIIKLMLISIQLLNECLVRVTERFVDEALTF